MKKKFDCVAMKHAAQKIIRQDVQGMTQEEEIAYFRAGEKEFRRKLRVARQKNRQLSPSK